MALYDELLKLKNSDMYPLHMPGHKRNPRVGAMAEYYGIDITEIDGFDDLHAPEGLIKEMAEQAAEIYGAHKAYLSVNGSTAANEAAIMAVCKPGDKILISRNSHKSVYFGIEMCHALPIYIYPEVIGDTGIYNPLVPSQIAKALDDNPDCQTVIITSPTYEGLIADVEAIAETVHEHNAVLIVDCAHGAHFGLSEALPQNPICLGADLVVMSLHKMLPAPTQTALLLVSKNIIERGITDEKKIQHYMDVFQSSSPSYILMAGIGEALDYIDKSAKRDILLSISKINEMRSRLLGLKNISVEIEGTSASERDPFKLVISSKKKGIHGRYIYNELLNKYHIQCEMCGESYALGILTVMDTDEGYERTTDAIIDIDNRITNLDFTDSCSIQTSIPTISMSAKYTIADAVSKDYEIMELADAAGKVSADYVSAYPPGTPLLVPGEMITDALTEYIQYENRIGLRIQGLIGDGIKVIKDNE